MQVTNFVYVAFFSLVFVHTTQAAPTLSVVPSGSFAGNRQWLVKIAADPSLFETSRGGSMAVGLAFSIDDPIDLVNVAIVDRAVWDSPIVGHNPYIGDITSGIYVDFINDRSFISYGSNVVSTGAPTNFLRITTAGVGATTLRYGIAASGTAAKGSIIAQAGQEYKIYTGIVTVPELPTLEVGLAGMITLMTTLQRRVRSS